MPFAVRGVNKLLGRQLHLERDAAGSALYLRHHVFSELVLDKGIAAVVAGSAIAMTTGLRIFVDVAVFTDAVANELAVAPGFLTAFQELLLLPLVLGDWHHLGLPVIGFKEWALASRSLLP